MIDKSAIDHLSVWAVRYALGRMTYAVNDVVDTLIAHRDALRVESRRVICRDIDEAIARGNYGMEMDRREWERLRDELAVQCSHFPGQAACDWCRPVAVGAQGGTDQVSEA